MGAHICGFCNSEPCVCQRDTGDEARVPPDFGDHFDSPPHPVPRNREDGPVIGRIEQLTENGGRESATFGPPRQVDVPPGYGNGLYATERQETVGNDPSAGGGVRLNAGKNKLELLPPEWEYALGDVTTQGSKKYAERNWERGMEWTVMIGCMKRHLAKFEAGERYDGAEFDLENGTTGCHHLAMVAWNALALMTYDLREIGKNDLPKEVTLKTLKRVNAATSDLGVVNEQHQDSD